MMPTRLLDLVRYALILLGTAYLTYWLWQWHWIAGLVGCIPIFVIFVNVVGFLTLPLYALTPEASEIRREEEELKKVMGKSRE